MGNQDKTQTVSKKSSSRSKKSSKSRKKKHSSGNIGSKILTHIIALFTTLFSLATLLHTDGSVLISVLSEKLLSMSSDKISKKNKNKDSSSDSDSDYDSDDESDSDSESDSSDESD
jgi:hypothetical protein